MKALVCREFGPVEKLTVEEIPAPRPGAGQVLVDVKAASLNFLDALMVQGLYQVKPPLPFTAGHEIAGVIAALGEGVSDVREGDAVIGTPGVGGFAEQCLVARERLTVVPAGMDFAAASAFLITYCTTLHAFEDCARLLRSETVLVLGATGGVGTAAVEIGKALGARVIAAVSGEEKAAAALNAGADVAMVYPAGPFEKDGQKALAQLFKDAVGPGAADVILDPVGGDYSEAALRSIAWEGRFLVVGFPAGIARLPLNLTLLRSCDVCGGCAVRPSSSLMITPSRPSNVVSLISSRPSDPSVRTKIFFRDSASRRCSDARFLLSR